jgi:hypothetical protein
MTPNDLREIHSKADPVAAFFDIAMTGTEHAKRSSMKIARGLKARILRVDKDAAGNPITVVRVRRREVESYLQREQQIGVAKTLLPPQARIAVKREVREMRKKLDQDAAKGEPIVALLWHFETPLAPAMVELLKTHPVRVIKTEFIRPNNVDFLNEEQLTARRAAMLEKHGRPLEKEAPETPAEPAAP